MDKKQYLSNYISIDLNTFWTKYKNNRTYEIVEERQYLPYAQDRYKLLLKIDSDSLNIKYILIEVYEKDDDSDIYYNILESVLTLPEEKVTEDLICYLVSNKHSVTESGIDFMCQENSILKGHLYYNDYIPYPDLLRESAIH